jgi:hypothetical protein
LDIFTTAQNVGDGGFALSNAALGRKFGYDNYMSQLCPSVPASAATKVSGAINNAAGHKAGVTSITVDGFNAAIGAGSWFTINGIPYRVTSTTGGATPTAIVVAGGLLYDVADNDVVSIVTPTTVSGAYAAGTYTGITLVGGSPAVGQMISFQGSTTQVYTIIRVAGSVVYLDRPLVETLSNSDAANLGPSGDYNFAFNRNAISLVTRPLAMPMQGIGAQSAVISYNGLSMRATLSYDTRSEGTRVNLGMLCGVKVLDTNQGVVLLG